MLFSENQSISVTTKNSPNILASLKKNPDLKLKFALKPKPSMWKNTSSTSSKITPVSTNSITKTKMQFKKLTFIEKALLYLESKEAVVH